MSRAQSKRLAPLEDVFANHPIAQLLGIRLLGITRSRIRAELPVKPQHMNRGGRVAGGVIMTFADLLGARGTVANLPPGARTTTLESKTNFFAAGEAPLLHAVSVPLHIGRTTMVWQTTVRNADGRMVAVVTQTQMVLLPRADKPVESAAETEPPVRKRSGASARPTSSSGTRSSATRAAARSGTRRVNGSRARIERP
ncbi:MAG: hotdog fold thioesterase [Betaproteobacteria bacterium]|nr:hotdog fold thioesterase [Betaproteobacteria bacterium]